MDSSSGRQPPHDRLGTHTTFTHDTGGRSSLITELPSIVGIIYPAITCDAVADRTCDEPVIIPINPERKQE